MTDQTLFTPILLSDRRVSLFHKVWPATIIAFALLLTAGWAGLLGYGLFQFVNLAL
jgi:hypothetical protein